MNTIQKTTVLLSLLAATTGLGLLFKKSEDYSAKNSINFGIHDKSVAASLKDEEAQIWEEFGKFGITEQSIEDTKKYFTCNETPPQPKNSENMQPVSQKTKQLIYEVLKDFNQKPNSVKIIAHDGHSPAACTESALLIHETIFQERSDSAKKFIIAHEIQHLINHDNYTKQLLYHLFEKNNIEKKIASPLFDRYQRFTEMRADFQTASKNNFYAGAYLEYAQDLMNRKINVKPGTHPADITRVQMANAIIKVNTNSLLA